MILTKGKTNMCLTTVDLTPTVEKGIGWKVFLKHDGKLYGEYRREYVFREECWLKNKKEGFYLFKTREGARAEKNDWGNPKDYRIRKVEFKNVKETGIHDTVYHGFLKSIVAHEIYVLKGKV